MTKLYEGQHMQEWAKRPIPDVHMAAEGMRRLSMMGLIQQVEVPANEGDNESEEEFDEEYLDGCMILTRRGRNTLAACDLLRDLLPQLFMHEEPSIEACALFAAAQELPTANARRVAVIMALLSRDANKPVVGIVNRDSSDFRDFKGQHTVGVGHKYMHFGWQWMALGYFLWVYQQENEDDLPDKKEMPDMLLHNEEMWRLRALYDEIAQYYDEISEPAGPEHPFECLKPARGNLVAATMLEEDEVRDVEGALLAALHVRYVLIDTDPPADAPPAVDLLTARAAKVRFQGESLDHAFLRPKNQKHKAYTAIYRTLYLPKEGRTHPLMVSGLTYISRDVYLEFGRRNRQEFPDCYETISILR
ncbi:hypothetical protein PG996_011909 [Apiospora saccharicola]|uniref:Uncharacterized protein n=1 Tax=Apiospora saccharicola TaxID=335842 RepID=A0ABR1UGF6_9PEZI